MRPNYDYGHFSTMQIMSDLQSFNQIFLELNTKSLYISPAMPKLVSMYMVPKLVFSIWYWSKSYISLTSVVDFREQGSTWSRFLLKNQF